MDRDRRRLLELLAVTSTAGLAGCSMFGGGGSASTTTGDGADDDQSPGEGTQTSGTTTQGDDGGGIDIASKIGTALDERGQRRPAFDFSYEPVSVAPQDPTLFRRAQARPATTSKGDRLQFVPASPENPESTWYVKEGESTAEGVAATIRALWNVAAETTATTQVNGREVTLAGGETELLGALVGTGPVEGEQAVLAVRGADLGTARSVLEADPFPLR